MADTVTVGDRKILVAAIEQGLSRWKEWQRGKSLLGSYPPDKTVLEPLIAAIEKCADFKVVEGHSLFSGYAGVVLHAPSLALPLLYQADSANSGAADAADWLLRLLQTRTSDGIFNVVIWGLTVDRPMTLSENVSIVPFEQLPDSSMKRRLTERAELTKRWREGQHIAAWASQTSYDLPGAAIVKKVRDFPYIASPDKSFGKLGELEADAKELLPFLQTYAAGQPLVAGSWFEYEDTSLDINQHENYLMLSMPEIVPHVPAHAIVDPDSLAKDLAALWALPGDWRKDLLRSMERFTLSQCRHHVVDQVVDLAIAFEIAMHGTGEGPMSWKAAVRSAQLIGGPLPERQKTRTAIEDLFKLRNRGAHGSSLRASERTEHDAALRDARIIYRAALKVFLSLGDRPKWKILELEPRSRA